jgi:hypothetical protein
VDGRGGAGPVRDYARDKPNCLTPSNQGSPAFPNEAYQGFTEREHLMQPCYAVRLATPTQPSSLRPPADWRR